MAFDPETENDLHRYSLIRDWMAQSRYSTVLKNFMEQMNEQISDPVSLEDQSLELLGDFPLVKLIQLFGQEMLKESTPESIVDELIASVYANQV